MSPKQVDPPAHPLLAALAHGIELLEAGALEEAALWLAKLAASCEQGSRPVPAPVLAQSRALLDRATTTAMAQRRALLGRLGDLAAARRAQLYRAP